MTSRNKQVEVVTGKVTIIETEERFPQSTEILMQNGFSVILLNMVFGLLPTTLYGTRLNYFVCSVAQAYALVFGICMLILSIIFIPVTVKTGLASGGGTGFTVMVLIKVAHVCGFIFLLIRGRRVAKNIPQIWNQLARLVQISVIELHGKKYHCVKKMTCFARYATFLYLVTMIMGQFGVFSTELARIFPQFFIFYDLHLLGPISTFNRYAIIVGYVIWKFCSYSHILVSIMAGYLVVTITVCLRAVNDKLLMVFEGDSHFLGIRKRVTVKQKDILEICDGDEKYTDTLSKVKNVMVMAENVVGSISKFFGVSLIVEVLILIANMLVNLFYILVPIRPDNDYPQTGNNSMKLSQIYMLMGTDFEDRDIDNDMDLDASLRFNPFQDTLQLLAEAFIHSYFFYRLCCAATEMVNEAKEPLQILKSIPHKKYSKAVQRHIQDLKSDLASTTVTLTATNYFQINKFLLTSVTGSLTTYIVVLLQFNQQEQANAKLRP